MRYEITVLLALALTNYAIYYFYRYSKITNKIRNWFSTKISPKLASCSFCLGFWLSPITILMYFPFSLDLLYTYLAFMFYMATANYILSKIVEKS